MPGKSKALHYAENILDVHGPLRKANQARENLDDLYSRIDKHSDQKRTVVAAIKDREMEIVSDERGSNPDMSQAQMDRHLKVVMHNDAALIKLRDELENIDSVLDGCELDAKICSKDIDIAVARMNELGGYFSYLAAVKAHG